jgi:hypothetical protein
VRFCDGFEKQRIEEKSESGNVFGRGTWNALGVLNILLALASYVESCDAAPFLLLTLQRWP